VATGCTVLMLLAFTPDSTSRGLCFMQEDILNVAVMPTSELDVMSHSV